MCFQNAAFSIIFIIVRLNFIPNYPGKQCFKVLDRETKKEGGTICFEIAVNLTCTFSWVNLIFFFICYTLFAINHIFEKP